MAKNKKYNLDEVPTRNADGSYNITYNGDDYTIQPSALNSGNITVTIPEVVVKDKRKKNSSGGSIHIAPSKRGTFTAAATKHGMSVQEFASRVLKNKDDYSPSLVKKANFARNASKWH